MFSIDFKEQEEEKKKKREKKVDELIKQWEESEQKKKTESKQDIKISNKISFEKNYYFNKFIKYQTPTGVLIGAGLLFWVAGFCLNEISKAAYFLRNISLPSDIVNLITTASFWKVTAIVSLLCATIFLFKITFDKIKYSINEYIGNKNNKKHHQHFCSKKQQFQKQKTENLYPQYQKNKILNQYSDCISKNNYKLKQKNHNYDHGNKKQFQNTNIKINKNDRNKSETINKFNIKERKTKFSKRYDKTDYYKRNTQNKNHYR